MLLRDKRLSESVVDLPRLRRDRLRKVQREMRVRDLGALVLTDIVNIRYCTGVAVMPLWSAVNIVHYVVVSAEGDPVIFEYGGAEFRQRAFWPDVRPSMFWQARVTDSDSAGKAAAWARQIKDVLEERGLADARIGVDVLDYHGFTSLQAVGLRLADSDRAMSAARTSNCRTRSSSCASPVPLPNPRCTTWSRRFAPGSPRTNCWPCSGTAC